VSANNVFKQLYPPARSAFVAVIAGAGFLQVGARDVIVMSIITVKSLLWGVASTEHGLHRSGEEEHSSLACLLGY